MTEHDEQKPSNRPLRILHGPRNTSGQPWEYAQGLRRLGLEVDVLTFESHPFGYPDDVCLHLEQEPSRPRRRWRLRRNFLRMMGRYDLFHFHFGQTLLRRHRDLPWLNLLGKKMVMHYWGSEIRQRAIAERSNPYFGLIDHYLEDEAGQIRDAIRASRYIDAAIVADYELYDYVSPLFKQTYILPQIMETESIEPRIPDPARRRPVVVHSPSKKRIKGTEFVEQAVQKLKSRYDFELRLLHEMKNEEVKHHLKDADIVVDQLLLGAYGIASVEAMAMGKPVLCYIREDLTRKYPGHLPIVNANPDTIERELERLLANPGLRQEIGRLSRGFVESYHDSGVVSKRLLEIYEHL